MISREIEQTFFQPTISCCRWRKLRHGRLSAAVSGSTERSLHRAGIGRGEHGIHQLTAAFDGFVIAADVGRAGWAISNNEHSQSVCQIAKQIRRRFPES